jgi:hypothetical protein
VRILVFWLNSSVERGFSFINMHIRSDKRNQLRLRTHMTKEDVAKYRAAVSGDAEDADKAEDDGKAEDDSNDKAADGDEAEVD